MARNLATHPEPTRGNKTRTVILASVFALIAIAGLWYVKWNPYYAKAITAATKHNIGNSIISGKAASAPGPSISTGWSYLNTYWTAVWKATVLGLLLGSLVQVIIPRKWIRKALGDTGFGSTAAAGAAALPGMMCSCCAAPVTVGLRKNSASVNASLAFYLGNPVLNPATIIFMGFVLGWQWAIFRITMGLVLVFGIATLASRMMKQDELEGAELPTDLDVEDEEAGNLFSRWMKALWQLAADTIPAYLIVVTVLGAVRAWLFPAVGAAWGNSILAVIGLAIAGTAFVIPTAAEIPIVQSLLSFGLGAGPAAALLMTLPAVSLASLWIIRRAFPARIIAFVAAGVAVMGMASGFIAMALF